MEIHKVTNLGQQVGELLLAMHAAKWVDFNQTVKIMGDGNSAAIFDLIRNEHVALDIVDGLGSVYAITKEGYEIAEQYRRESGEDRIKGYRKGRRCGYCGEKIQADTAIAVTYINLITENETEILVHDGLITSDLSSVGDGIFDREISVDASCYEQWSHYKAFTFADVKKGIQTVRINLKK